MEVKYSHAIDKVDSGEENNGRGFKEDLA